MTLLGRSSRRWLTRHRIQLVLSVVGVALGVAVVLAIDLAIQSSRTAFRISAETVSGRATHQVSTSVGGLDEDLLASIRIEAGLRESAPVVEGYASSPALPGMALRILGVDPLSEGPFRPLMSGVGTGGGTEIEIGAVLATPRAVVLAASTAERAGVALGDSLPVVVEGERSALPVVGVLDSPPGGEPAGVVDLLLMDVSGAQEVLRRQGLLSRIDLRVPEGPTGEALLGRVRALLPTGATIRSVGTRAAAMSSMIAAFDVNLTALSLLALVFGMFLIYNAVTFSVVQRRALLGQLRALGVTRREVLRMILAEAAVIGAAGAAVGLAVGVVLANGLVRLVTRTISDLYFTVSVERIALEPVLVAKATALGLGATVLAALPPALEAAGTRPGLAVLRSVAESRARSGATRAAALGLGAGVSGALLIALSGRSLVVSFTALFLVMTGAALLTPLATVFLVGLARPVARRAGGILGVLAARGVVGSLSRTAPAIAALVVAVSVTVGLGVMIQSFRDTLGRWLDGTLRADVYVSLPGPNASRASGTLWPDVVASFVAHPEVVAHSTYRGTRVFGVEGAFDLVALSLDRRGEGAFDFLDGSEAEIMAGFQAGRGAIVSEPYAFRRSVGVGDSVVLAGDRSTLAVPILGVFYDYGSDQGTVMVSRSVYDRAYDDAGITSLGLFLADGADSDAVVQELLAGVGEGRAVIARTNDALRRASLEVFDRTFEVTAVLRLLAFIVAFVGVLSALTALELERSRELAVLRANGLTPGQLRLLVLGQTGLVGAISGLLAVPLGIVLSVVMIYVINKRSFGWTLQMHVGAEVLAQGIGLALVGALLAGLYPARRMSRASPAGALRGE